MKAGRLKITDTSEKLQHGDDDSLAKTKSLFILQNQ